MSAINDFFAQLTGGGASSSDAPSSTTAVATAATTSPNQRGNGTADGGGGGSGGGDAGGRTDAAFGVPLTGAAVTYDPESDRSRFGNPQCETVTTLPDVSRRRGLCNQGALVAANADFLCYGIKSNIRVIHRSTSARALIKLSSGIPQDMSLLETTGTSNKASGLLGCATSEGDLFIWELMSLARAPSGGATSAEKTVEVSTAQVVAIKGGGAQSVAWHPSEFRFLAVVSGSSAVICDFVGLPAKTTGLKPPVIGGPPSIPGGACLGHFKQITDASFSPYGDVFATASEDGTVRVWDTREVLLEATPFPQSIACLRAFRAAPEGSTLSRILVVDAGVDRDVALITGDEENRLLKVWPEAEAGPVAAAGAGAGALEGLLPSQVLALPGRGALSLEVDPEGKFVFAADTEEGLLYALHLAKGRRGVRLDYLRPYSLAHPAQSFAVLSKEPEPEYGYDDIPPAAEDRVLELVCVQTKPVQIYRITVRDALPPAGAFGHLKDTEATFDASDEDITAIGGARRDPPASPDPEKVGRGENGVVVEASFGGDAEEVVGVCAGGVDRVALSKDSGGGGEVGVVGKSAPSFEKKLDITDEPLGLPGATTAAAASSVSSSRHPSATASSGSGKGGLYEEQIATTPKPIPPFRSGMSAVGTPPTSGAARGDGATGGGGGEASFRSAGSRATSSSRTKYVERRRDADGAAVGGGGAVVADRGDEPTAAEDGWEGAAKQDWGQEARGASRVAREGVVEMAATSTMADTLSDASSTVDLEPGLAVEAVRAAASATVGGASSSSLTVKSITLPSPMPLLGDSGGGGEAGAGAVVATAAGSPSSTMPAAAPRERVASEELRRFLNLGDVQGFGAAADVPPSPLSAVGETSGAASAAAAATEEGGDEEREAGASSEEFDISSLEGGEQSVSVSVSEERQEVGATTTEDSASFAGADGGGSGGGGGGGGGGQATGGGGSMFYSSNKTREEVWCAFRHQGGGECVVGGGGGGGGGVGWVGRGGEDGAGEPSASGSFGVASAHGDASGGSGSSAPAAVTPSTAPPPLPHQQHQLSRGRHGREADSSAGASPVPMATRHHSVIADSPSGEPASSAAQLQPSPPPLPRLEAMVAAALSPTAGGEASRDVGPARSSDRSIPGVTVDQSATRALRSLLMGGGSGRAGRGGAAASATASAGGQDEAKRFWSSGGMAGGGSGGGGSSAKGAAGGGGGGLQSVARSRADAEGAGAGLAKPHAAVSTSAATATATSAASAATPSSPFSTLLATSGNVLRAPPSAISTSASAALAVRGDPAVTLAPSSTDPPLPAGNSSGAGTAASSVRPAPLPALVPAVPEINSLPPSSLSTGKPPRNTALPSATPVGDGGGGSLFSGSSLADVTGAPAGGPDVGGPVSTLAAPQTRYAAAAPPAVVPRRQLQQQQPPQPRDGRFDGGDAGFGRDREGVVVEGMDAEKLIEAVTARVTEDMDVRLSALQASLERTVVSCCRQTILASTATAEETRANERAVLVGDITSSVDRSVRKGVAETVANPLAKLVVNTARQIVADPLQVSMSTLLSHQQRQQQALAAAASAGAQAGVQSQASGMATATARAQAGNVRRELMESREDLSRDISRAVASAVQEPVGVAFRECFEGQLIPRIQGAVQRMFEQINESLNRGLQASPLVNNRAAAFADDVSQVRSRVDDLESGMRDVSAALSGLGMKMERLAELTLEIQQTGQSTAASVEAVAAAVQPGGTPEPRSMSGRSSANAAPPVAVDPREELHHLVVAGRVDEAMNRALSASDLPLVMWLCGRLDPVATPSTLPQHILLCLVQQFGASDLLEDTTAKLKWLQNCVLAIDPMEATIKAHLPVVLRQLKGALSTSTPIISQRGGNDVAVVRLTTHVVNSLSMPPPAGAEGM